MARVVLHLTDNEFYRLTPRQLRALRHQYEQSLTHSELLTGIIASTVANYSFHPPKKPHVPSEFMPSQQADKPAPKRTRKLSAKQMAARVRALFNADPRTVAVNQ
jgi:hypothetical protein